MINPNLTWTEGLCPGTILSFHFPEAEDGRPGKARPCLVIAAEHGGARMRLVLAYGTSAGTPANRGLDLVLDDPDDWQGAGLTRPSRFVLARCIKIAASDPRLSLSRKTTPVIGRIPAQHMTSLPRLTSWLGGAIWLNCLRGRPPQRRFDPHQMLLPKATPNGHFARRQLVAVYGR